jgi:GNAT superfamily N-acetyltransferase
MASAEAGSATRTGTTRCAVTVTFLRMTQPPRETVPLPDRVGLVRVARPSVAFYRYLYHTVGGPWLWWLRRSLPDEEIARILAQPAVSVYVLYEGGEPAGFFELENRGGSVVNLSYFGLFPHAIGTGLGRPLLHAALQEAWGRGARAVTVNTCTADHPRALPTYLRAGFAPVREVREVWDVPDRVGIDVPSHLKV